MLALGMLFGQTVLGNVMPPERPSIQTDGYTFKFSLDVKADSFAPVYAENDITTDAGWMFRVLQNNYGEESRHRITFWFETGVGTFGRGGSQVDTEKRMELGRWHHVTVEKTLDQVCVTVDDTKTCSTRQGPRETFWFNKDELRWAQWGGKHMNVRNFVDHSTLGGPVTLYSGDDFDGSEWVFNKLGDYAAALDDFKDEVVSSMKIEGDVIVTVYVHCPKDVDSVTRAELRELEAQCLTAGGESMTLTAGAYVGQAMGIPINTLSYLRIEGPPTSRPTSIPTANPTATPTEIPTAEPSAAPTPGPTANPTKNPTAEPTATPTAGPTAWGRVTLYSGDDYDGSEWVFNDLGDYAAALDDFKDEVVSSIKIEGDFKATVYVHCPKDVDSVTRADLKQLEAHCLTAGGESMTLTAGGYVSQEMGIPINTLSYLRIEELFRGHYTKVREECADGKELATHHGKTLAECSLLCDTDSNCVAFNFAPQTGLCMLKSDAKAVDCAGWGQPRWGFGQRYIGGGYTTKEQCYEKCLQQKDARACGWKQQFKDCWWFPNTGYKAGNTDYAGQYNNHFVRDISFDLYVPTEQSQLTWYVTDGTNSWQRSKDMCIERNQRLCTRKELCPSNEVEGGKKAGDLWVAVSDENNEWIQAGDGPWPACAAHDEIAGGIYGKPSWGPTTTSLQFRKQLACCSGAATAVLSEFKKLPNHFPKWAKCHFTFEDCEGNTYDDCKKTGPEICGQKNCHGWSVMQERFFPFTSGKGTVMLYYDRDCIVSQMTDDVHWETYLKAWHLAPRGASKCDYGVVATQSECEAAVRELANEEGVTPGRGLVAGSANQCGGSGWGLVPLGCSAQTGGDWAAHFSAGPAECSHDHYQLVCSGYDTSI